MRPGDEIIVPEDLRGSCNVVTSMWSVEGKPFVILKFKLQLKIRVEL